MSRILRWIRSCQWSKVWVPSPVGAFLVVIFSLLVGSGWGPLLFTPVFSVMSLISRASNSSSSKLELVSLILAYWVIVCSSNAGLHWIFRCLFGSRGWRLPGQRNALLCGLVVEGDHP